MDKVKETLNKVPLSGYIVLVIAIAIFSGLFANAGHGLNIFDFDTLNGKFGTMKSAKAIMILLMTLPVSAPMTSIGRKKPPGTPLP